MPEVSPSSPLDVFVHVPKTAGTSVRAALIAKYGRDNVFEYSAGIGGFRSASPKDIQEIMETNTTRRQLARKLFHATPPMIRNAVNKRRGNVPTSPETVFRDAQAVCGHFALGTYERELQKRQVCIMTVIRDPLERMKSHYGYIKQQQALGIMLVGWTAIGDPGLPFERYALSEPVRNVMTGYTGTDISRFDLIGTQEDFKHFLVAADLIDPLAVPPRRNQTYPEYRPDAGRLSASFRTDFEQFHAQDYAFYDAASRLGTHAIARLA